MDVEDLLREGMQRFTEEVPVPTGVARRAAKVRRRRMAVRAVAAAGTAAVTAVAALVAGALPGVDRPPAGHPAAAVHVNLAAWSVNTNPDGTVTVKTRQVSDPRRLQHVLAEAGIPALVRWGEVCWVPPGQYLPTAGIVDGPDYVGGEAPPVWIGGKPYPNTVWTFTPSKMPPGARYMITATPHNQPGYQGGDWSWGLIRDNAHLTCRPLTPPADGTGGRPAQARTTAVVTTRVANARAAGNKVIQTEMIFSAAVPSVWVWNYRLDWRFTQSGYFPPALGVPWARGWENWGTGNQRVNGRWRWVQIDYGHHRWSTGLTFAPPPNACTVRLDIVEFMISQPKWPAYIRQGLSCGLFHLAGHGPVNGVQAIRLTGSQADWHFWSFPHAPGREPLRVDVTLYVNPKTYLPMLVIWHNRTHHRDGRPWDGTVRDDITALPATPANIAKANVTFPASFHRVPGRNPFNILLYPYFTSG